MEILEQKKKQEYKTDFDDQSPVQVQKPISMEEFWKIKLENIYYYSKDFYEIVLSDKGIDLIKVSSETVYVLSQADSHEEQKKVRRWVLQNKRLKKLPDVEIINHIGDESYYEFDGDTIKAYIALTPVEEENNDFIDAIIDNAFGEHAEWFRQYLAMFAYTSHKRLPMLVLYGKRGTGKNAVA
ncbi:MAG: hypothetical protein CL666_03455 [Balneola sp.]|nr:hypothetical protein [Balneola sp.]|tara:strand:- start:36099 stop:36647 length:549 start_codon:yes stop_codon:yes gene_type:complete